MKRILFIFGTRPEAIKMIPLIYEIQKNPNFHILVCISAQHREMLDEILDFFKIKPDYDLNIMKQSQDLFDITINILKKLKQVIKKAKPDLIFVHGDTSTAFVSSLAAYYYKIKIAHIEAGLRTNDLYSPYPEEANRQLIGVLAYYHFVPTQKAKDNLIKENKNNKNIIITGNTVIDALFLTLKLIKTHRLESKIKQELQQYYVFKKNRKFILVTAHRRENFGSSFEKICKALEKLALHNPKVDIIYPLHPNPNVSKPAKQLLSNISNIFLIPALKYEVFVYLMSKAYFIMSDSGGIQEEAPSLKKPVLVLRENTERPEGIEANVLKLVGTQTQKIFDEAQKLLDDTRAYETMTLSCNPYGDAKACKRIMSLIEKLDKKGEL